MNESAIVGLRNRFLQGLARGFPGGASWRVRLHRWRGVKIGEGTWIGYDCILETSRPHLVTIGSNVVISLGVKLVAHFRGATGIVIEDDVFVGPGVIILPGVTIRKGAVVTAGSVVSSSVPAMTVVQGNPARAIAKCGVTLTGKATLQHFYRSMKPVARPGARPHANDS